MDRACVLRDFSRIIYRFLDFSRKTVGVIPTRGEVAKILQLESLARKTGVIYEANIQV